MRNGSTPEQFPVSLSVITQFYPPDYAATGQLIEELVSYLANQGMQVRVFTGQPGYAFEKNLAATIEYTNHVLVQRSRTARLWPQRIRGKALNGFLFCLRSALHLCKASPQKREILLVTTAPPYLPFLGYLANLFLGVPYVCLLFDLYPDVAVALNVISEQHWLTRLWITLNRQIWRRAEALVVLSPTMRDRIFMECPEVADKISVVPTWADPKWIVPLPKKDNWFAQEHKLVNTFTVLYSGNMGRCHDIDTILEAIILLQDAPVQFVFIGNGAKRQACMDWVKHHQLQNCLFLPYQDKQIIPYSLTACDLALVSMGPHMEGLIAPSKLYGSLAAGRPIAAICETHSYLRQIIADANCGACFDIGDSAGLARFIRCLITDPDLSQRMGIAGRQYMESHFTPEIISQKYLTLLRKTTKSAFPSQGRGITTKINKQSPSTKPNASKGLAK